MWVLFKTDIKGVNVAIEKRSTQTKIDMGRHIFMIVVLAIVFIFIWGYEHFKLISIILQRRKIKKLIYTDAATGGHNKDFFVYKAGKMSSFAKVGVESESKRILKVKNYIDEHYKDEMSLEQLAGLVGMTPTAFSRYFKQRTSKNISEYIVDIRLGHAARMLIDTTDSVSEICWRTGFNTISNFNRLFRKRKGCSPTEFREKYQKTKVIV